MGKKFKKIHKISKKVKKSTQNTVKKVEKVAKQTTHYTEKKFNQATGAIENTVDKAVDYTKDELNTAAKYAEKQLEKGADWVENLAEQAIEEAYRAIYKKYVGNYVKFVEEMGKAERKIFSQPSNILTEIRDNLLAGKFSQAEANLNKLLASDVMKQSIDIGHKLFGTTFIVAADLSFGVSGQGVTGGGGGSIGITQMMDHFYDYKYKTCVFTSAGGALGVSNSEGPGAEVGISLGFLAKDPTNISGWFVDVSGEGNIENGAYGLGMSWAPPGKKPPYVKAKPVAGVGRIALSTSEDPSGALTIGASYTWIIQKVKNDLYRG